MTRPSLLISFVAVSLALASMGPSAHALQAAAPDDGAKVRARDLAKQGDKALAAKDYKAAAQLYREAIASFAAPTLTAKLGEASEKSGALVEARDAYRQTVDWTLPPNPPKAFVTAQARAKAALASLSPRIPSVTIAVVNGESDAEVAIDQRALTKLDLANPIELNPGPHVASLRSRGAEVASRPFTLDEGKHIEVKLEAPAAAPSFVPAPVGEPLAPPAPTITVAPPAPPPTPLPPPVAPPLRAAPSGSGSPVGAYVLMGLGGAAALTGLGLIGGWYSKKEGILEKCDGTRCPSTLASEIKTANGLNYSAIALPIIGGALLGVGVVLLATHKGAEPAAPAPTVGLFLGPGSLAVRGAF